MPMTLRRKHTLYASILSNIFVRQGQALQRSTPYARTCKTVLQNIPSSVVPRKYAIPRQPIGSFHKTPLLKQAFPRLVWGGSSRRLRV